MSAYNPLGAHIHVRAVEPQAVSRGGIIIPDTAKKRPLEGLVLAVGPGWRDDNGKLHALDLKVGERVLFGKHGPVELDTDKDLAIHSDHILAVIGTDGETIRAYQDNVILRMAPQASMSTVIEIRDRKAKHRKARVLVSGVGYVTKNGALIENTVREGQEVVVDALAGQNYDLDVTLPRYNKGATFDELFGQEGDYRICRHDELLALVEREADEGAN